MRKTIHINLRPYRRLSNANFKLAFNAIITSLDGNRNFVSPVPGIAELQASLDEFSALAAAVEAKNFARKPDRDLVRSTMLMQLMALSAYCSHTALQSSSSIEEAVAIIQSANFAVSRAGGASKDRLLPAPGNLRSKSLSQAVEIQFDAVKNAYSYIIMTTMGLPSEQSKWAQTVTSRVKHRLTGIPAGQIITCKVYAYGASGMGQPSGYISQVAGL